MKTNEKIAKIRELMRRDQVQAVIIPSGDPHMSEYFSAHWKTRSFVSGFTGSAGTYVITEDSAGLWTDGRYYVQAEKQIADSEAVLFRAAEPDCPTFTQYLYDHLPENSVVGLNGKLFSINYINQMKELFSGKNIEINIFADYGNDIWEDRPAEEYTPAFYFDEQYSGKSAADKLEELRETLRESDCDALVIGRVDNTNWLFNVRARDIPTSPLAISYGFVSQDEAVLFTSLDRVSPEMKERLTQNHICVKEYEEIYPYLEQLDRPMSVLCDEDEVNYLLYNSLQKNHNIMLVPGVSPIPMMKAVKNEIEIANTYKAYLKDGCAEAEFYGWLFEALENGEQLTDGKFTLSADMPYLKDDVDYHGDLTVNGGHFTFKTDLDNANGYAIRVTNGGNAVINDVVIESQKAGILVRGSDIEGVYPDSSTTLIVNDATINSSYYAFAVWGYGYDDEDDNDNVVLTVKNADVTVRNEIQLTNTESAAFGTCAEGGIYAGHTINIEGGTYTSNTGCYFPSYGEYNISGGTFDSSMYGIRICAGELTISGSASINVDAEGTVTSLVPNDGKTDWPTGTMGPLTIGKQTSTGYPGDIVVNIKGGTLTNNTEGGNAITVYDDNLASTTYNNQKVSVTVSGGTVTGDVEYVHTDDTESDSNDVSYEMTGGTVDGNIVADASVPTNNITITSGVVTGTVPDSSKQPTGTVKFPGATEPVNFYGSFTMPAAPAERPGYTFKGYCLDENGTGTIYQPGATVTGASGDVTVYEIWEEKSVDFEFEFDFLTFYLEEGENYLSDLIKADGVTVTYSVSDTTVATGGTSVTILSVGTTTVTAKGELGDRTFTDSFTLEVVESPGIEGLIFNPVTDAMVDSVGEIQVDFAPVSDFLESTVMDIESVGRFMNGPISYASLGWDIDASNYDDYDYYVIHYVGDGVPTPESVGVTATAEGLVVEFEDFSPYMFGYVAKEVVVDPEPDPPFNPGWGGNDDDVYIPPTIVVDDSSSSDDNEMMKVAACAAAAVAAAIIALILVAEYRKR